MWTSTPPDQKMSLSMWMGRCARAIARSKAIAGVTKYVSTGIR